MLKKENAQNFWDLKRIFYVPKFTTKNVCTLGLLIAITVVLSWISGYLRIGNISKLSISFVSVFIAAYAFGGITGGLVGVLADLISCFINPIGPLMIQITLIEFVFGFIYAASDFHTLHIRFANDFIAFGKGFLYSWFNIFQGLHLCYAKR